VTLYSKNTRALTFEKFLQVALGGAHEQPRRPLWESDGEEEEDEYQRRGMILQGGALGGLSHDRLLGATWSGPGVVASSRGAGSRTSVSIGKTGIIARGGVGGDGVGLGRTSVGSAAGYYSDGLAEDGMRGVGVHERVHEQVFLSSAGNAHARELAHTCAKDNVDLRLQNWTNAEGGVEGRVGHGHEYYVGGGGKRQSDWMERGGVGRGGRATAGSAAGYYDDKAASKRGEEGGGAKSGLFPPIGRRMSDH
jgi:hypothetical protein